jgi:glutathione S-transferase
MQNIDTQNKPFRLITISISHYCEKVRWALTKLKLPYIEEAHMPPFHRFATVPMGGKTVPILVTQKGVFTDSTDILKYLDSIAPPNAKLYPTEPELRQQVEELEELFDNKLGVASRLWAYSYLKNESNFMQVAWSKNVPFRERIFFPIVFPFMQKLLQNIYRITPESGAEAYEEIQTIFDKVGELLSDGRGYLVGDRLSVADITFAALAAPVIAPPEHPIKRTKSQDLPPQMICDMNALRQTPAGAYALRLYRERNS